MDEEERDLVDEPKMPSNPVKKAKTTGKTVVNSTFEIAKRVIGVFKALPIQVKIVIVGILALIIIVVVLVLDVKADETSNAVNKTISSYLYTDGVDEEGKKLFLDKASLIKFPLKDINAIYQKFIKDGKYTNDIVNEYSYVIGTKDVKDSDATGSVIVSQDLSSLVEKAVAMAQKGGIKYCQDDRQTASTLEELDSMSITDCSAFVYSLFKVYLNIDVGDWTIEMIEYGKNKHSENGWTGEIHNIGTMEELQPGDLLLTEKHVALYIGDGKLVDHGGDNSKCCCDKSWRGPKNKDVNLSKYKYYVRYTKS